MHKKPDITHADLCPVCEQPNHCGMVAGKEPCWCMTKAVVIPEKLLEALASDDRNVRCICRACIEQSL